MPPERAVPQPGRYFWIILSAKTLRALEEKAAELTGWLKSKGGHVSLIDLSFTLSTGRWPFEERLAFVARDLAEVHSGLEQFLGLSGVGIHVWRGKAAMDAPKRAEFMEPGAAWVSGANVDWTILYNGLEPRRIQLPAYPFARERYWYDALNSSFPSSGAAAPRSSERADAVGSVTNGEESRETKWRVRLKDLSSTPATGRSEENPVRAAPVACDDDFSRKNESSPGSRQSQLGQADESLRIEPAGTPFSPGVGKEVVETADIIGRLRQLVARTFCVEQSRIPDAKKLVDLGLDSILAVELAKGISAEFKINLPAARLYDHPSIQHLAKYVSQGLSAGPAEPLDSASIFFPTHLSLAASSDRAPVDFVDRRTERSEAEHSKFDTDEVTRRIRSLVALTLFLEERKIDDGKKFADLGLDSILAVELVKMLNGEFGVNLSAAALYSHATTRQLAVHIGELLSGEEKGHASKDDRFLAPVFAGREPRRSPVALGVPSAPAASELRKDDDERSKTWGGSKFRRVMITGSGSIADLRLSYEPAAVPAAHEVQISVNAASVMLADLLCARGLYPTMPPYPFTPGFEVAGTVMQAGGDVADFRPGDRVCGLTGASLGGHAELVNVDSRLLVVIPEALAFPDACTLPVSFLTARYALSDVGRLAPEETLLVHSAASCTGLMAIQLALRAGVKIVATVGSQEKVTYLRELGVEKGFQLPL